jgi:hypothetical protein
MELVLSDLRTDSEHPDLALVSVKWYADLPKLLAPIIRRFKIGKQNEELRAVAALLEKRLYALQTFCDTRFGAAEHKVYLNVCRDLPMLLTKMKEHEASNKLVGGAPSMAKENVTNRQQLELLLNFVFVGRMFGMVDLLRLYKSCSEFMQLVNALPWEKVEVCDSFQGLIAALAEELGDGTMDDVCFKFCAKEGRSVFLEGTLEGHTLSLGDNDGVLEDARADVLEYLQEWCHGFHAFFTQRIINDISKEYRWMLGALDLRVLIQASPIEEDAHAQLRDLKQLWIWARRSGKVDLPDEFSVMGAQHRSVSERLSLTMAEPGSKLKQRWEDQQHGTAIMKDLLTHERLYKGNTDWCCLPLAQPLCPQDAPGVRRWVYGEDGR